MEIVKKNALQQLTDLFASFGLTGDAFARAIADAINDNSDSQGNISIASATAQIRNQPVYQQRFQGNTLRKQKIAADMAAGKIPTMSELSEASYIALEDSYREVLKKAQVPPQYYEDATYLAKMVGNDLSVSEVSARASLAKQAAGQANPEIKQQLQSLYGVSENQIAAFFLDPILAQQTIDARTAGNAAIISAAAQRSGLALNQTQSEQLAQRIAPESGQVVSSQELFAGASQTAGLAMTDVSGGAAGVNAEDVILASTGNSESQAKLEKERQKRQAEYKSASGMAETQKGVVGLQRANL
jgi:copper chaperone CopZ